MKKLTNDKVVQVAYCRVSTEQESQQQSFQSQMKHYQEIFKENGDSVGNGGALYQDKVLTLANNGIYADEGISGAKAYKNRQAFMRMMEDARLGLFNKIWCKNIYRFSRDIEAGVKFIRELRNLGVEVYFEEGGLSTLDPSSDLVINMMLTVAQEESRAKSSAIQWGVRRQQEKGKYHGIIPPYGYDKNEDGYLTINKEESKVVKYIFDLYLNKGYGTQKIARQLNSENIPTKLKKQWSNKQITTIISNEIYKGTQITNKINSYALGGFVKKEVPKDKQIVHEFEHLIIIDEETFDMAQEEVKRRSKDWNKKAKNHRPSQTHLLSNLIKCGNCGGGYGRKKRRAYVRKDGTSRDLGYEWVCNTNDKYGKDRCKHRNMIVEVELIEEIKEKIKEFQKDKSSIYEIKNAYIELYYNAQQRMAEKKELESRLNKLDKQVELNFDLLSDEIISKEEYKKRNNKLQEEIKEVKESIAKVSSIGNELKKVDKDFNAYIKLINSIDVDKVTNHQLKRLIDKIEVTTDNGEKYHVINWRFLKVNIDKLGMDMTMQAMQQDHPDMIPPEFKNQQFRV